MLHECVQTKKKYLCIGSQKFTNGYLGIHTDGFKVSKPFDQWGLKLLRNIFQNHS